MFLFCQNRKLILLERKLQVWALLCLDSGVFFIDVFRVFRGPVLSWYQRTTKQTKFRHDLKTIPVRVLSLLV